MIFMLAFLFIRQAVASVLMTAIAETLCFTKCLFTVTTG